MDIIKKLSRSIREYKMVSIMTPVCIVFEVIFEILIPFMMAKMIDSGISSGNESALVKYGTLLILCVMAGLVFVDNQRCDKAGTEVKVTATPNERYEVESVKY